MHNSSGWESVRVFLNDIIMYHVQARLITCIFFCGSSNFVIFGDVIEATTDEHGAVNLVHEDLTGSNNSEYDIISGVSAVYIQVIAKNFISNSLWFADGHNIVSW